MIWSLYKRLRHTYGYGVHSPLAYRLVTDVLMPGRLYGWYGYEDVDKALRENRSSAAITAGTARIAYLLLRLAGYLDTRRVWISPRYSKEEVRVYSAALRAARSDIRISTARIPPEEATLTVAPKAGVLTDHTLYIIGTGKTLLLTDTTPEGSGEITRCIQRLDRGGIALEGRGRSLFMVTGQGELHSYRIL
ncbi:MAG: hypothetical protein NC328_00950 [Muribaculum sp.]|nr:hypothetical protein [Muribaculum sp.]